MTIKYEFKVVICHQFKSRPKMSRPQNNEGSYQEISHFLDSQPLKSFSFTKKYTLQENEIEAQIIVTKKESGEIKAFAKKTDNREIISLPEILGVQPQIKEGGAKANSITINRGDNSLIHTQAIYDLMQEYQQALPPSTTSQYPSSVNPSEASRGEGKNHYTIS